VHLFRKISAACCMVSTLKLRSKGFELKISRNQETMENPNVSYKNGFLRHDADYAVARSLSVRLSVTRRYCVETTERVLKLFPVRWATAF